MVKKFGSGADVKDRSDEQLREMAGLRGQGVRSGKRQKTWTVDEIIGARIGARGREYIHAYYVSTCY